MKIKKITGVGLKSQRQGREALSASNFRRHGFRSSVRRQTIFEVRPLSSSTRPECQAIIASVQSSLDSILKSNT